MRVHTHTGSFYKNSFREEIEKKKTLTEKSSKIFLSSLCPCLSARCAGSEPSKFFILEAQVAPEHWSKWIAKFFKPNFAAQWRRVGSSLKWVSVSVSNGI